MHHDRMITRNYANDMSSTMWTNEYNTKQKVLWNRNLSPNQIKKNRRAGKKKVIFEIVSVAVSRMQSENRRSEQLEIIGAFPGI